MNQDIALSYIIVTRNKLPYLKVILGKLIDNLKADEEIMVADGASTDGSREYLEGLKKAGSIGYLVSEPDFGVGHAMNKLILTARGALVKLITDDDAFDYPAIAACKAFMLAHPAIDMIGTEGGVLHTPSRVFDERQRDRAVRALAYAGDYRKWLADKKPFSFCELGVMFRRSALPVIGLRDLTFNRADMELSFRVTAGKVALAWYTGYTYVNIMNPQSASLTQMRKIKRETERLNKFYLDRDPDSFVIEKLKVARNRLRMGFGRGTKEPAGPFEQRWPQVLKTAEDWIGAMNAETKPEFIYNR